MDLSDLFPDADYEFRMGIRRGDPTDFFRPSTCSRLVLAERQHWLRSDPRASMGIMPGGERLLDEAIALLCEWRGISAEDQQALAQEPDSLRRLQELSEKLEPDLLFLAPGASGQMELLAAAVCFPSSWAPEEKLGRPMTAIHEPAPGLNQSLGNQIDTFLARLRPGVAWLRNNWGLSASPERNQHPSRILPRLTSGHTLDQVWLRVERQAIILLPASGGVLFCLKIETEPLSWLCKESPEAARGLAHALTTMPAGIAHYKGIADARESLVRQLTS